MFNQFLSAVVAIGIAVPSAVLTQPTIAGQLNGRAFDRSPSLVETTTSNPVARFPSFYKFTLTIPVDSGAPLQAVTIAQDGVADVRFDSNKTVANDQRGDQLSLASTGGTETKGRQTIVFNPPVQPGRTVTITLAAQNPGAGGIYLFGVTAYPVGSTGLFLGYGRLTFYDQQG